ncbi:hypothetical protein [Microbacterium maritypicum]|uniref:hypothetical protein n=1 Tax=Microbacterium maritypicum TaxID=33918 RepID=UPI00380DEBCC
MPDDKRITVTNNYELTVKQEVHFSMRASDWVRLRKKVETLKKQRHDFSSAGWGFSGIAVSAAFSMIAWAATYRTFSDSQLLEFAWVWPTLIASFLAGALLSVGAFVAAHLFKDAAAATAQEICEDMDEIHDPSDVAPTRGSDQSGSNNPWNEALQRAILRRADGKTIFRE